MKARFALSILLILALMPFALSAGCGSDTGTLQPATADERAVIEKFLATPADDSDVMAALFTEDAVLEDYMSNSTIEGRAQIARHISQDPTLVFEAIADAIKLGDFVVQPTAALRDGNIFGYGVHVFEITGDGLIKHLWVSGAAVD